MSSSLLFLFKDLSGSLRRVFQLLSLEDQEVAVLVLKGRFPGMEETENLIKLERKAAETDPSDVKTQLSRLPKHMEYSVDSSKPPKRSKIDSPASHPKKRKTSQADPLVEAGNEKSMDIMDLYQSADKKEKELLSLGQNLDPGAEVGEMLPLEMEFVESELKDVVKQIDVPSQISENKSKSFDCEECDYSALNLKTLRQHMQKKHGTKYHFEFKCDVCPYEAKTERCVKVHKETAHRSFFPCIKCGFKTTQAFSLDEHIKTNHPIKTTQAEALDEHIKTDHPIELTEIEAVKIDIAPMSFIEAKKYILKKLPAWSEAGLLESSSLRAALLEFGWELEGLDRPPRCTEAGRARLKQMFV